MTRSDWIATLAVIISVVSGFYTWDLDKKNEFNQCVDEVKQIPQSLFDSGKLYSKSLNRYLAVQTGKYESDMRNSSRAFANNVRAMIGGLKKFNCSSAVSKDLSSSINMVSSSVKDALANREVDFDLVIKNLDQITKYKFQDRCCSR